MSRLKIMGVYTLMYLRERCDDEDDSSKALRLFTKVLVDAYERRSKQIKDVDLKILKDSFESTRCTYFFNLAKDSDIIDNLEIYEPGVILYGMLKDLVSIEELENGTISDFLKEVFEGDKYDTINDYKDVIRIVEHCEKNDLIVERRDHEICRAK